MTAALASQGVQYGTVTIGNGSATGTASINAMGSGGFLLWGGQICSQAGTNDSLSMAGLSISGGTVTGTRNTSDTSTVTIPFCAVDGDTTNLIKSVNFGTVTLNSGQSTLTAAIPAVTVANTAVAHLGFKTPTTSLGINTAWPVWAVASTTTVSLTVNTSGGSPTGYFCAIEFQSAALANLQAISDSASPGGTTRTHTITNVIQGNTFNIFAGCYSSGVASSSGDQYGQITANTTLTIGTSSAPFITIVYNCFVVSLQAALIETSTQRALIAFSAQTSKTATITTVDVTHAITTFLGNSTNGSNLNAVLANATLTNGTTVTGNTGASMTGNISFEVIALNPAAAAATANPWYPVYNDQSRPNYRPQADFVFQTIPTFVPPPFTPYALYSDQKRPNYRPQADFVFMAPQPLNIPTPWLPVYPDFVPSFKQQIPSGMVEPIQALNFPMRWQPRYMDLPRPVVQPFKNFFFAPPWPLNIPTPWLPVYPDFVPSFKQQIPAGMAPMPIQPLNFPMPWQPRYMDLPRPYLARQGDFVFEPPYAFIAPVVANAWYPIYQDLPRPNLRPQADFVFLPPFPLNIPTPWRPRYPDQVPFFKQQIPSGMVEPVQPLNLPTPWLPQYVDLARETARVKGPSVFAAPQPLNFPMPWLPSYPDALRARYNVQNTNQLFNIQTIIASSRLAYWISFDGL